MLSEQKCGQKQREKEEDADENGMLIAWHVVVEQGGRAWMRMASGTGQEPVLWPTDPRDSGAREM